MIKSIIADHSLPSLLAKYLILILGFMQLLRAVMWEHCSRLLGYIGGINKDLCLSGPFIKSGVGWGKG